MNPLPGITVGVLLLVALLVAIFKGSRPPQPIPSNPTAPRRAAFAAFVPVVCAVVSYATFRGIGFYLSFHHEAVKPFAAAMRIVMFAGGIAPWFVGAYFAYVTARAANKALRAIGALETLLCAICGSALLFSATFGFG
jgi:hypothetical protein